MGELVQRDPQTEVARTERVALLEPEHVGSDVVHGVVGRGPRGIVGDEEVVLAEDALAHPTEQHPHLGTGDPPTDRSQRAVRHALPELVAQGCEETLHRLDVGLDPPGPVEELTASRARRTQTGELGHERLRLDRDRGEVAAQRIGEVRRRERLPTRHPTRDPDRELPVDGIRRVGDPVTLDTLEGEVDDRGRRHRATGPASL